MRVVFNILAEQAVATLLEELFDQQELRQFVYFLPTPENDRLAKELPPPETVSLSEFIYHLIRALQRRGMLDDRFFEHLIQERPIRSKDIRPIQALFTAARRDRRHAVDETSRFDSSDDELRDLAFRFFTRAGHAPRTEAPSQLRVDHNLVVLAENNPPNATDAFLLGRALMARERGYFVHRGPLSERVQELLDQLRVQGHPIAPVSLAVMRSAIDDDACTRVLHELNVIHFEQQNLFEQKNAIRDRRFFFGRERLLTSVGDALARGDAVLLTGLRKAGKTSFLHILRQHMVGHPWHHVDLQRFDAHADDWPLTVARELVTTIDRWGREHYRGDWPWTDGAADAALHAVSQLHPALEQRRRWLNARGHRLRPVLVLDEGERVFPRNGEAEVVRKLISAGALRAHSQGSSPWLSILAADLRPTLSTSNVLPGGATNPFYEFFQIIPIELLTRDEIAHMTVSIGRAMGVKHVEDAFVTQLHAFSGGHPGLARTAAAEAYRCAADRERLDFADWQKALGNLHRSGISDRFFKQNIWSPMTALERQILQWLHAQGNRGVWDQVPTALQDREVWAELVGQGVLRFSEEQSGTQVREMYTIAMAGLVHWLDRQPAGQHSKPRSADRSSEPSWAKGTSP